MATIDELVARIKTRVSRHQDSSLDAKIVVELAAAQESLEEGVTLPWFLLWQDQQEVTGIHESFSLTAYTGFIRIADDEFGLRVVDLTRTDEQYVKLVRQDTYDKLVRLSPGVADEVTLPEAYYVHGSVAHIRKKQIVPRTYRLSYYKKDPTIPAAGATTLWSHYVGTLLLATAGIEVARHLRDKENVNYFESLKARKYGEMVKRNQASQDADQNYVMDE
jgi:hypothetical protein